MAFTNTHDLKIIFENLSSFCYLILDFCTVFVSYLHFLVAFWMCCFLCGFSMFFLDCFRLDVDGPCGVTSVAQIQMV